MSHRDVPIWRKPIDAFAGSRIGSAILRPLMHRLDRPLMRLTGGRFALTFGLPTLLLTTTGRKSGEPRSTPLVYHRQGEDLAVIGTRFGSAHHPAWYHNLRAKPEAAVLLGGEEFPVTAREATVEEREEIWARATKVYGGYQKYRSRLGDRQIPIIILSRLRRG